jgi:phytanoyl-CoA hydroxylase
VPSPRRRDVLVVSYLTSHGSGINVSDEARTTVLIQMRDPADPPAVKTHESRGQGMMLRGVAPISAPAVPAEAMGSGARM